MADFPRIKWLNVDGQQVPFTEPQHFTGNGDETVRTGKDNPLPVANYTKKGNIWLPVSEENPVPTQVAGSNVEVIRELVHESTGTFNAYFADSTSTGPTVGSDLDVSNFKKIRIHLFNNTDKEIEVGNIYFRSESGSRRSELFLSGIGISLPSGSGTWINHFNHKDVDSLMLLEDVIAPYFRISVRNQDRLGEGTIEATIIGVRK